MGNPKTANEEKYLEIVRTYITLVRVLNISHCCSCLSFRKTDTTGHNR